MQKEAKDRPGSQSLDDADPQWQEAIRAARLSDRELALLASLGRSADASPDRMAWAGSLPDETEEQREERQKREAEERQQQFERWQDDVEEFRRVLLERDVELYEKGVASATDLEARRSYVARSMVLLLVVLAVVLMPIIAIVSGMQPQDFGTFIAPVTGIAGTVVGYWFGAGDRATTQR